jgi:hypothetical protein
LAIFSTALLTTAFQVVGPTPAALAQEADVAPAAETGIIDTTFSGDGAVGLRTRYSATIGHDPQGRLVIASYNGGVDRSMGIARFEADGTVTGPYNGAALAVGFAHREGVSFPTHVKATSTGLAVVGEYYETTSRLGVLRLTATGTLDGNFSSDGRALYKVFNTDHDVVSAFRVEVLQGDKIGLAVAAFDYDAKGVLQFTGQSLIRILPNGSLDPSFSGDGRLALTKDYSDIGFLPDGGLYAGRQVGVVHEIRKLLPTGSPDDSFSGDGVTAVNCKAHRGAYLTDDPSGRPVLMCIRDAAPTLNLGVFRFTTTGAVDTTYSGDGKTAMVLTGGNATNWVLEFDEAGLPWAAIRSATNVKAFLVYTLDASGAPNAAWSGDGVATATVPKTVALEQLAHVGDRLYVDLFHYPDANNSAVFALVA